MQLLEDKDLVNFGNMAKRIAVLRNKVEELLENNAAKGDPEIKIVERVVEKIVEVPVNSEMIENAEKLLDENLMLKKQLEAGPEASEKLGELLVENQELKEQLLEVTTDTDNEVSEDVDKVLQENIMLKKQINDREKTIKELDFKLEMFKLAKSLREGAGINTKSVELKNIINEYIKEIDKSIASLNIE